VTEPYVQFAIRSGQLSTYDSAGTVSDLGLAYSGAPGYVNDPDCVVLKGLGPIPPGWYSIGADIGTLGPLTLPLTPDASAITFGRGDFRVHGANQAKDENEALGESIPASSEGCIVAPHQARAVIATFARLLVTA
jgi:Protein of unknown function (DUF2778)